MAHTRAFNVRKFSTIIIAIAFAFTSLVVVAEPAAEARTRKRYWKGSEECVMKGINKRRTARGIGRLSWDRQLGYVGRVHARAMARSRDVRHDYRADDRVTRWRTLGQNTGRSTQCRRIVRSFMRSYAHRVNILGSWRYVGVGVVDTGRYLWVQVLFESRRDPGNIWQYP